MTLKKKVLWAVHDIGSGPLELGSPESRSKIVVPICSCCCPTELLWSLCAEIQSQMRHLGPAGWTVAGVDSGHGSGCLPSGLGFLCLIGRDRERT